MGSSRDVSPSLMPWRTMRIVAKRIVAKRVRLTVEGLDNVPTNGPVLLVARHYHNLFDGAILLAVVNRPLHPVVAVDWVRNGRKRAVFSRICRSAAWPTVFRTDGLTPTSRRVDDPEASAVLRWMIRDATALLGMSRAVLMFPEGHPTIDPSHSLKPDDAAFLPFQSGFARLALIAARSLGVPIPIVHVGFEAERPLSPKDTWDITIRFGEPWMEQGASTAAELVADAEQRVRALCGLGN